MRLRSIFLVAVTLVCGCAAPGTGASRAEPSPAPSGASSPAATCPPEGLSFTAGEVDGALGLRAMPVELVNCGTRSITLDGYPGARLADDDGPLTFSLKHGVRAIAMIDRWDTPPAEVTVKPGQAAVALFVWRGTTEFTPEGPQTATRLAVSARDGLPYVPAQMTSTIDLGTTGKLAVSPWRRDPQGDRETPSPSPSLPLL